jgi:hypothetical protein
MNKFVGFAAIFVAVFLLSELVQETVAQTYVSTVEPATTAPLTTTAANGMVNATTPRPPPSSASIESYSILVCMLSFVIALFT